MNGTNQAWVTTAIFVCSCVDDRTSTGLRHMLTHGVTVQSTDPTELQLRGPSDECNTSNYKNMPKDVSGIQIWNVMQLKGDKQSWAWRRHVSRFMLEKNHF